MKKYGLILHDSETGEVHGQYTVVVAMNNDEIDLAYDEATRLEDEENKIVLLHVMGARTLDCSHITHDINVVAKGG